MWNIKNEKYTISYSFLTPYKTANGMMKYIFSQKDHFLEKMVSYVYIYSIKKTVINDNCFLFYKYGVVIDGEFQGIYSIEELLKNITESVIAGKKLCAFHVHHLMYSHLNDLQALLDCTNPVSIYFYLHDFYSICSQYNLMKNNMKFCGENRPSEKKCTDCIYCKKNKHIIPQIKNFLNTNKERLIVVSPSKSTAKIWSNAYPNLKDKLIIIPHKEFFNKTPKRHHINDKIRLAFLGRPVEHKGWNEWLYLVEHLKSDNRFDFYVLGNVEIIDNRMKYINVTVSNNNLNAMVNAIKNNNIDITFMWPLWPETYSYTCLESIESGSFIITNYDSGNVYDLVVSLDQGIVFDSVEKVVDYFCKIDDITLWKRNNTEKLELISTKDNLAIIEECCKSTIFANDNIITYHRCDFMPKGVLYYLFKRLKNNEI